MKSLPFLGLFCALFFLTPATAAEHSVILLTLDGVRIDEIHGARGKRLLPRLHAWVAEEGLAFGHKRRPMWISNPASKSLPGYRALMSGRYENDCTHNDCAPIQTATVFDRIPGAVFASWDRVARAVTSGPTPIDGTIAFEGLQSGDASPQLRARIENTLAAAKKNLPPWKNSRWDRYTWDMAFSYLAEIEKPLTYLSFVDSDEWAHDAHRAEYLASIREFDRKLSELREWIDRTPGRLARTSFVITTDHGRGQWYFWRGHGRELRHSKKIWAFVIPSKNLREKYEIRASGHRSYSQTQIRSTIEALLEPESRTWSEEGRRGPLVTLGTPN